MKSSNEIHCWYVAIGVLMVTALSARADMTVEEASARAQAIIGRTNISLINHGMCSHGITDGLGKRCFCFKSHEAEDISIDVDAVTGRLYYYNWGRLRTQSQEVLLTLQQARGKANTFLTDRAKLSSAEGLFERSARLIDHGAAGKVYAFEWGKIIDNIIYPFGVSIDVSVTTGEIIGYSLGEDAIQLTSLTPKLSREEVIKIGQAKTTLQPGSEVIKTQLVIGGRRGDQKLMWRVSIKGIEAGSYSAISGQIGYAVIQEVDVDANTGQANRPFSHRVPNEDQVLLRQPIPQPNSYTVVDSMPYWSKDESIVFMTRRQINDLHINTKEGANSAATPQSSKTLVALASQGKLEVLLVPPRWVHTAVPTPNLERLAFWMNNEIYILDLKVGSIGRCNDGQRAERGQPAWDTSGKYLVMAGMHSPSDKVGDRDADIFAATIRSRLGAASMDEHWCISVFPGADNAPIFSPDGQFVAFVHLEESNEATSGKQDGATWWGPFVAKAAETPEGQKPEAPRKIIGGLPLIERISYFPDGRRLLISYAGNGGAGSDDIFGLKRWPEILDIENKTLKPLNLPILHDPDLPKGKPLIVRQPVLNSNGTKIAFSALRWSGDPKDDAAICIYTCNIDGSDLKRITPPTAQLLVPYQYPQPGITALNAWEKLEPKPNRGVPWNENMRDEGRPKRRLEEPAAGQPNKSGTVPQKAIPGTDKTVQRQRPRDMPPPP